jgi:hypothetical protein
VTRPEDLRAGDADRDRVVQRLRSALEEGRLTFVEYDERVGQAYAAITYGELEALLTDLPGTALVLPLNDVQPRGNLVRRWIWDQWERWVYVNIICLGIWGAGVLVSGGDHMNGYWPAWVAGPWGAVILARTINGLASGEPQAREQRRIEKAERKARAARELAAREKTKAELPAPPDA